MSDQIYFLCCPGSNAVLVDIRDAMLVNHHLIVNIAVLIPLPQVLILWLFLGALSESFRSCALWEPSGELSF